MTSDAWLSTTADTNRCVPDPQAALAALRTHGEVLGFRMGANYPAPSCEPGGNSCPASCCLDHWQGVQRLSVGDARVFAVSSSHRAQGSHLALVRMGSRPANLKRMRGNRMSTTDQDWDVAPPTSDAIVRDVVVSADAKFNHPGGIQALGRYLFVPLENIPDVLCNICALSDGSDAAAIAAYDVCSGQDPATCNPTAAPAKLWTLPVSKAAKWVTAAKLSDGRYLLVVGKDGEMELRISQSGAALASPTAFGSASFVKSTASLGWDDYQNVNLVTQCGSGNLFLLASHNTGTNLTPGNDWIDLWQLEITEVTSGTNRSYSVSKLVKISNRHLYCSTPGPKQCDLDAAGGVYVDPDGRLLYYATEHDDDGPGFVKMMEFRPANPVDEPDTVAFDSCPAGEAFVELFENADLSGRSLMIDFNDRALRQYNDFTIAASFTDKARSARWCMPPWYRYRLFQHDTQGGSIEDLAGTGYPTSKSWPDNPGWSSGCFRDATKCL